MEPTRPFVASCGSGVTANSLIFAAHLLGNDNARLYDGSWSEWGADPATPKALGPGLAEDDAATSRELAADLFGQRPGSPRVRFASLWRSSSSASIPAAVAPTSRAERLSNQRRFASLATSQAKQRPRPHRDPCRSAAERIDQAQRMANAGEARNGLGISLRALPRGSGRMGSKCSIAPG